MITLALSTTVGAPTQRVWRALVDPEARIAWDERVLGEICLAAGSRQGGTRRFPNWGTHRAAGDVPAAPDAPLRTTRWRFRLGGVPLVMVDRILQAEPGKRIVSKIVIGSMQFEQTLTLQGEQDETGRRTRVGMKLVAQNSIVVIGEIVPRGDVQKLVIEYIDSTLRQLQKHCESEASEITQHAAVQ